MSRVHELKCAPHYFSALQAGTKTFEVRFNDRNFKVGDILNLREYDEKTGTYSGATIVRKVTYILDHPSYCLPDLVIMGLKSPSLDTERIDALAASAEYGFTSEPGVFGVKFPVSKSVETLRDAIDDFMGPLG